ncbi:hypothetical protein AVEN_118600-1 [Araneus ventricosus]|uniref:Uncharacterized protein n=1 Tax=Araneus ventricosus TaxID=182803 RepID=A0A4Y2AWG5_ARAVE|nr:hypothetical protein AVEN_118600-1 [Araneus ventricosus]
MLMSLCRVTRNRCVHETHRRQKVDRIYVGRHKSVCVQETLGWMFTTAPFQNQSSVSKTVRIEAVWSGPLHIQPVSISNTPFGLMVHKIGNRYMGEGDFGFVVHLGNRRSGIRDRTD